MTSIRDMQYPVSTFFKERYSPRSFMSIHIEDDDLMTILEAASTAPSSYNIQPWRFVLGAKEKFMEVLMEANRVWCKELETFVLVCAETAMPAKHGGSAVVNPKAEFDTGTAWGYMTIQAYALDIYLHAMGGFDHDAAQKLFHLPNSWKPMCIVAFGYPKNEEPMTPRKPLDELILKVE